MLQRTNVTAGGNPTAISSGGVANASINRRRGAVSKKRTFNTTVILLLLIVVLLLIATVTLLFVVLSSSTADPGSSRHGATLKRFPGVPNLLRGKVDPVATDASMKDAAKQKARDLFHDTTVGGEYPYPLEEVDESYDIAANFVVKGGSRFPEYAAGESPYTVSAETRSKSDAVARTRRFHVKKAMQFAWDGYVKYAFGMDEILPQSGKGSNGWGGQGITLVDSLDTLWLMDMKDEFWQARDWVRDHLDHSKVGAVSMFETTIRDLGGLLAAYDWSGDKVFIDKATDLGERLLHGFDGSPTGIPFGQVSLNDGRASNVGWSGGNAILAEFGTIQLEFRFLAKQTGRPDLATKSEHVFEIMNQISPDSGLFPYFYRNNVRTGTLPEPANDKLSFGAMADSFYEYMLKIWLQGGKTEPMYRDMYDKAMDGMHRLLLQKSTPSGLTYIADMNEKRLDTKMDHLVCFMGGLLALGAYTDPLGLESERAIRDLKTAKALTYTCYQMYARMNTGIAAEFVQFSNGQDFQIGRGAPHYLLRPEAVESMFILNQLTGDPVYREWGWEIFQAIEKYCKTKYAYGALSNVQDTNGQPRDKMESFFLAETLKYLYLLQDPDTEVDILTTHVFNTEAHPLRIFPALKQK
jgi:Glycosyl hydrolase family 47